MAQLFFADSKSKSIRESIGLYLKMRKTIYTQFISDRNKANLLLDAIVLRFGIKFIYLEDWSTLVTRFLGAS